MKMWIVIAALFIIPAVVVHYVLYPPRYRAQYIIAAVLVGLSLLNITYWEFNLKQVDLIPNEDGYAGGAHDDMEMNAMILVVGSVIIAAGAITGGVLGLGRRYFYFRAKRAKADFAAFDRIVAHKGGAPSKGNDIP